MTSPKDGPREGAKSPQQASLQQAKDAPKLTDKPADPKPSDPKAVDPNTLGKAGDASSPAAPMKPGTATAAAKPDAAKSEPAKGGSEPVKSGPTGSSALSSGAAAGAPSRPQDVKSEPVKTEPAKTGSTGSSALPSSGAASAANAAPAETGKPSVGSGSPSSAPTPGGNAPLKPGSTGSSAVPPGSSGTKPNDPKAFDAKPDAPAKAGATGSSAVKPDASASAAAPDAKGEPGSASRPGAASGSSPGQTPGATRVTETASLTDGPILDLKAKRVPDPADAKTGVKPETGKAGPCAPSSLKTGPAAPGGPAAKDTVAKDTVAKDTAGKETAKAATPRGGGAGFGSVAASGLIGGLIGAGLLYGVTTYQRGADPRLAALDKSVAGLATKDAVAALDKRLAASEQVLKPLPDAVARAEAAAKTAGERANEALQKAGAAPAAEGAATAATVPADLTARLDALDQRVSALQEEPGRDGNAELKTAPAADPAALAALDDRIKALEANGAKGTAPDLTEKLAALQNDLSSRTKADEAADAALNRRVDEVQKALESRVAAATQAVQEATQAGKQAAEAAQARSAETAQGLERKLQEQGDRIASLDKAVDQSAKQATVQSALRIVAADRIASALEAGQPYPEALASLRNLEPADSKRLDALGPFADKGAPTAAGLAAEFRTIADKITEAKRAAEAKSVAETGSVGDRLMNMASSLVQVKRVEAPSQGGPQAGAGATSGSASLAQVQAALDRGDFAEAAKAYAALPEEARAQGGDFGARLSARAEAGRAAQSLLADAFTGLPPAR